MPHGSNPDDASVIHIVVEYDEGLDPSTMCGLPTADMPEPDPGATMCLGCGAAVSAYRLTRGLKP